MPSPLKLFFIFLLLGLLTSPAILLLTISDDHALVKTSSEIDSQTIARVKRILKQLEYASRFNRLSSLTISEQDLNGSLALAARGIKHINGQAEISASTGTMLTFSIHTPENPFGQYINATLTLPASSSGFTIKQLKIGGLTINEQFAQPVFEKGLSYLFGKQQSQQILGMVKSIRTQEHKLLIQYQPLPNLAKIMANGLNHSGLFSTDPNKLSKAEAIRYYHNQLCQQYHSSNNKNLSHYLASLFSASAQRSNNPQQAAMENQAALIATAIFFGSYKFNTLLSSPISADKLNRCQKRPPKSYLAQRQDLSLHFIYSAILKIMSDNDISFAMGEFKELNDTLYGGSGFSFADLAADQAGIQFASIAAHPHSAQQLQATNLENENAFFPDISGLKENITQAQLEKEFGGVDGEGYMEQLELIHKRINKLTVYHTIQ